MTSAPFSLSTVLGHYLSPQQLKRYLGSESRRDLHPARHYYNTALRDLSIRDSEHAIQNLILALELDAKHSPTLHLCRTMLFGLNKLFHEEGGEIYQMKYPNLNYWRQKLEQQIQEKEYEAQRIRNDIALHQPKGIWRLLDRWVGHWRKKKLETLEERLKNIPSEVQVLQKKRTKAIKMGQIQEYSKILSLVLEICLFPARYAWVNESANDSSYKEKTWYG